MKPCSISQFTDIDTGVVTLFLLESLVKTNHSQELVNYLNQWDCLVHLESELEKRDLILLSVLECLAVTNVDGDVLDVIVRVNEVMAPGMKKENNVMVRRRQVYRLFIIFLFPNLCFHRTNIKERKCKLTCKHAVKSGILLSLL